MTYRKSRYASPVLAALCGFVFSFSSLAQVPSDSIHEVEVRLKSVNERTDGVRVRLLRRSGMMQVAETFSSQNGQVRFVSLMPGEYIVETAESENFEATATTVSILPVEFRKPKPIRVIVAVDLPARKSPGMPAPGVVMADADLNVPEAALKHYNKGLKALTAGKTAVAIKEFKAAVEIHPRFYSARLELGRGLRARKHFQEAEEVLRSLGEIAPRRAEPRIEYAIVLLVLRRQKEAARELRAALELEEANWITHLHLGWALLEDEPDQAERHFTRALELDEKKAAQAHLSLARIAHTKGVGPKTIHHLEAYLALAPEAADAKAVRNLLDQLRK